MNLSHLNEVRFKSLHKTNAFFNIYFLRAYENCKTLEDSSDWNLVVIDKIGWDSSGVPSSCNSSIR